MSQPKQNKKEEQNIIKTTTTTMTKRYLVTWNPIFFMWSSKKSFPFLFLFLKNYFSLVYTLPHKKLN